MGPTVPIQRGDFGRGEHAVYQPELVQRAVPRIARGSVVETAPDAQATVGPKNTSRTRRPPREHPVDVEPLFTGGRAVGSDDEVPFAGARADLPGGDAGSGARGVAREGGEGKPLIVPLLQV